MRRNYKRVKIVSILLVILLFVQAFGNFSMTTDAVEYSYVTMEEIGFSNREYWGTESHTYSGDSWDNKILAMDITFNSKESDMQTYKNDVDVGGQFKVGLHWHDGTINFYLYDAVGTDTNSLHYSKAALHDKGIELERGKVLHIELKMDVVGNDLQVGLILDNVYVTTHTFVNAAVGINHDVIVEVNEVGCDNAPIVLGTPEEREQCQDLSVWHYKNVTDDLLLDNGTIEQSNYIWAYTDKIESFDNAQFSARLIASAGGQMRIGGFAEYDDLGQLTVDNSWYGIIVSCDGSNWILSDELNYDGNYVNRYSETLCSAGQESTKITLKFYYVNENKADLQVAVFVDDIHYTTITCLDRASKFGNCMILQAGDETALHYESIGERIEKQLPNVSYSLEQGEYFVAGNEDSVVNNQTGELVALSSNNTISCPGDYTIIRLRFNEERKQVVSLYKLGDVNLDGEAGKESDLITLEDMLVGKSGGVKAEGAAMKAADLNNDGQVGEKDLKLMQSIVEQESSLEEVKRTYYPDAMTYDYLGGNGVMPIGASWAPYVYNDGIETYNTLNDSVFESIDKCGINLLLRQMTSREADVIKGLELAEKYGIGWFVEGDKMNTRKSSGDITATPMDAQSMAEYLSAYSGYSSLLGVFVADEPSIDYNEQDEGFDKVKGTTYVEQYKDRQISWFTGLANSLNQFSNLDGYINHARDVNHWTSADFKVTDGILFWQETYERHYSYEQFLEDYIMAANPQYLSFDDYVFGYGYEYNDIDTLNSQYFSTMSTMRAKGIEHNIPFWVAVEAGGDSRDNGNKQTNATNPDKQLSEGETYWNVNTALAFGAKGIKWFPVVQPSYFSYDSTSETGHDYERNGLIGANGTETPFYQYAKNVNEQVAAVDEVLMKASNKGVIATGGYAASSTDGLDAMITLAETDNLQGFDADDTEGALIGVFSYRGQEAYYVMNYNPHAEQEITLNFKNSDTYSYIYDAEEYCASGNSLTMTIGGGKGTLVVPTPHASIDGSSLILDGTLNAQVRTTLDEELIDSEDVRLQVTKADGTTQRIPLSEAMFSQGSYIFAVEVAAKEMADEITLELYYKNSVLDTQTYSVKAYAKTILDGMYNDVTKELAQALLNYGTCAQQYFDYNIQNLANPDLNASVAFSGVNADKLKQYRKPLQEHKDIATLTTTNLVLKSETTLKMRFTMAEGSSVSDFYFQDGNGKIVEVVGENQSCHVAFTNIKAHQLDDDFTVNITKKTDESISYSYSYSALSYCYVALRYEGASAELKNLAKALYLYNQAANKYYHSIENSTEELPV